jgi:hypothetical protein
VLDRWKVAGALVATSTRNAVEEAGPRAPAELRVAEACMTAGVPVPA